MTAMIKDLNAIKKSILPCHPPIWAKHGHVQTILSHLIPSKIINENHQTHIIELEDGDQLFAKYYKGQIPSVIYLFHGLGGSSDSNYIQRTAIVARKLGMHVF